MNNSNCPRLIYSHPPGNVHRNPMDESSREKKTLTDDTGSCFNSARLQVNGGFVECGWLGGRSVFACVFVG